VGNTNALRHGAYANPQPPNSLDAIIPDLAQRINGLGAYIDTETLTPTQYLGALNLLGLLATRLSRIMRDQVTLTGQARTDLEQAIAEALTIVGDAWGVALNEPK
jgi:hypothetical protein